ncbi:methyltransferase [Ornithinimicrobium cryptoxanthini]|uniref:methyltransferase n=1 Tax=Ornithinimicrobium cryptoxanthini TaxID=2934161 RepID=UPI002119964B|nr:class I SAM-dependent methyltransferase [Ornithinimicrobium cryptoxanthini]
MTPTMDFCGLAIAYDSRVLQPRGWTADQSRWAADLMAAAPAGPVLELCCGAGHIGLLATTLTPADSRRQLVAVDINPAAVELTARNAAAGRLDDWVEVRGGDMTEVVGSDEVFAVIIADPPWVPAHQTGRFPEDPLLAIDGGTDGLAVARRCLGLIRDHLALDGAAVLQLGTADQCAELDPSSYGLQVTEVRTGESGVLVGLRRPPAADAR